MAAIGTLRKKVVTYFDTKAGLLKRKIKDNCELHKHHVTWLNNSAYFDICVIL